MPTPPPPAPLDPNQPDAGHLDWVRREYVKLIDHCDDGLSLLRRNWLEAQPTEKPEWLRRINQALGDRWRLMRLRDAVFVGPKTTD